MMVGGGGESKKTTTSLKPIAGVQCHDDVHIIEVPPSIAKHMQTIQAFIEDDSFDASSTVIPLPNLTVYQLDKIFEYLNFYETPRKASKVEPHPVAEVTAAIDDISVDGAEVTEVTTAL
ncbi:hypothetical protein RIF29_08801 [Crotalaria pallida]|uniref:SKP1 component POZ domain-containing protein n=1 Tax=Crotalaria pallida TaxID=3830 RepID=A0AAN9FYZ5_CROPI